MLNRQLMFDDAAKHMAQQRRRASADGMCLYRAPNGDKCAIGSLIPDAKYRPGFDGIGLNDAGITFEMVVRQGLDSKYGTLGEDGSNMYGADAIFARELQRDMHDHLPVDVKWEQHRGLRSELFKSAEKFALTYGLDFSIARRVLTREDEVPSSRSNPAFTAEEGERNHETYEPTYAPCEFLDSQ